MYKMRLTVDSSSSFDEDFHQITLAPSLSQVGHHVGRYRHSLGAQHTRPSCDAFDICPGEKPPTKGSRNRVIHTPRSLGLGVMEYWETPTSSW